MSNPNLSTGIPATHIGPETGNTGSATAGEGSGAGTQEQTAPAAASGLDDAVPAPQSAREDRSFEPRSAPPIGRASTDPIDDAAQTLRDIVDGNDHPTHAKDQ